MEGVQSEIVGEAASCSVYIYSGTNEQEWNVVWIVSKEVKEDLISVSRNSDPLMTIELGLEETVVTSCVLVLHKWVVLRMKKIRFGNI